MIPDSRFEIERKGLRIAQISDDPDGFRTYDRAFLYQYDERKAPVEDRPYTFFLQMHQLTNRDAWDIAKFLLRRLANAQALQAYKRLRRLAGLSERPRR
jgi:hypothetical protein